MESTSPVKREEADLSEMPYRELQKMAKSKGIKANLPKQSLIKEILALGEKKEEESDEKENQKKESSLEEEPKCFLDFVSQRRKKRLAVDEEESGINPPRRKRVSLLTPIPTNAPNTLLSSKRQRVSPSTPMSSAKAPAKSTKRRNVSSITPMSSAKVPASGKSTKRRRVSPSTPMSSAKAPAKSTKRRNVSSITPMSSAKVPASGKSAKQRHVSSSTPMSSAKAPQSVKSIPKIALHPPGAGISRIPRCKMPDFAKLHAKEFDKMENLESYLSRRKNTPQAPTRSSPRTIKKPSPKNNDTTTTNMMSTQVPSSFVFGSVSKKKEGLFTFSATPNNKSLNGSAMAKRNNFDLKSSLALPLKYKPHTGKIKSWGEDRKKDRLAAYKSKGTGGGSTNKKSSSSVSGIKGVRMNRRAELMLQRRKNPS